MNEILIGAILGLSVNEILNISPFLARQLVHKAAFWWAGNDQERGQICAEEWTTLINDRPGNLLKLITATSLAIGGLWRALNRNMQGIHGKLPRVGMSKAAGGFYKKISPRKAGIRTIAELALLVGIGVSLNVATSAIDVSANYTVLAWGMTAILGAGIVIIEIFRTLSSRPPIGELISYLRGNTRDQIYRHIKSLTRDDGTPFLRLKTRQEQRIFDQHQLSMHKHVVILGPPGSGKSTLLAQFAWEMLAEEHGEFSEKVPLLYSLAIWPVDEIDLEDWILTQLRATHNVDTESFRELLAGGHLTLLLDGFDELPSEQRRHAATQIEAFARRLSHITIVVTCRTNYFGDLAHALEKFSVIEIVPFEIEEAATIIESELNGKNGELASLIKMSVRHEPRLESIIQSPQLIGTLRAIFSGEGDSKKIGEHELISWSLRHGSDLIAAGEFKAAGEVLHAASIAIHQPWLASFILLLIGGILHKTGNEESATAAFDNALQVIEDEPLYLSMQASKSRSLTPQEREVMRSLRTGMSYDLGQISSLASLPPSKAQATVRALEQRGLLIPRDSVHGTRWAITVYSTSEPVQ